MAQGYGGTILFSGTSPVTPSMTARLHGPASISEFTYDVTGLDIVLGPGEYWFNVTPYSDTDALVVTTSGQNAVGGPRDGRALWWWSQYGHDYEVVEYGFSMGVAGSVVVNRPPDCRLARASVGEIWPPDHRFVEVGILGVSDADGDRVSIVVTGITQDEPVQVGGFAPDGVGTGTPTARLRAERSGAHGNGRVYHVLFTATDGRGGTSDGSVRVCVPDDQRGGRRGARDVGCVDDGQRYDSTREAARRGTDVPWLSAAGGDGDDQAGGLGTSGTGATLLALAPIRPNPARSLPVRVSFDLPHQEDAVLDLLDVTGRRIQSRELAGLGPGPHAVALGEGSEAPGLYFVRLSCGGETRWQRVVVIH
jgi:hypothetical protein